MDEQHVSTVTGLLRETQTQKELCAKVLGFLREHLDICKIWARDTINEILGNEAKRSMLLMPDGSVVTTRPGVRQWLKKPLDFRRGQQAYNLMYVIFLLKDGESHGRVFERMLLGMFGQEYTAKGAEAAGAKKSWGRISNLNGGFYIKLFNLELNNVRKSLNKQLTLKVCHNESHSKDRNPSEGGRLSNKRGELYNPFIRLKHETFSSEIVMPILIWKR